MSQASFDRHLRNFLRVGVLLLFACYFALVVLKSPFDFSDPEFDAPRSSEAKVQMVIENEPYDHFRTATASLLLGLLFGNALLSLSSIERRRFAVAILGSSSLLVISTFLGLSPLAVQPILLLIAVYGCCAAFKALTSVAKPST